MKHHRSKPRKRRKKLGQDGGYKQHFNVKFFRMRNKEKRKAKENFLSFRRGQNR